MKPPVGAAFADAFEARMVGQGDENRSILETLTLGWELLRSIPRSELRRVSREMVEKYMPADEGGPAGEGGAAGESGAAAEGGPVSEESEVAAASAPAGGTYGGQIPSGKKA